jgi:hypothetical protein
MTLYIVKSDQGDGGWSAHYREQEDEDGIAPTLIGGYASLNASGEYEWPTLDDVRAMMDAKQ